MDREALKSEVAAQAASLVEDGMVVGLGTGSTAAYFIDHLIVRAPRIRCIATSERSAAQARAGGLALIGFDECQTIDICVDGADEIQLGTLNLVKGLGGALLREKIVASAAKRLVIIADSEKLVPHLGTRSPVPVEVTPFGWELTRARLAAFAIKAERRLSADGTPTQTDGGNYIIDCHLKPVDHAVDCDTALRSIIGVVETGFFINMADLALVAGANGVVRYTRD